MKQILFTILITKGVIFLLIFLTYTLLPFDKGAYLLNFHENKQVTLQTAYSTWDAQHYLSLAKNGYQPNNESDRFFPLFPLFIRFFSPLLGYFFSGLFVANVSSTIGYIYFYMFVRKLFGDDSIAYKSLVFLLCFPTAFFLSVIYSESIFFCIVMMVFYYLYTNKIVIASTAAFLLQFIRPTGILILVPLFVYTVQEYYPIVKVQTKQKIFHMQFPLRKTILLILSPIGGILSYFLFMYFTTGNAFSGFAYQNDIAGHFSLQGFQWHFLVDSFSTKLSFQDPANMLWDRIFFIGFLSSLIWIWKKGDTVLLVYSLAMGLVPLLGSFMSYTRYMLMVFPLFIVLGKIFSDKKNTSLEMLYVFPSLILQTLFIILYSLNYWVA